MKFGLLYQLPCADWQSPQQRYMDTLAQIQLGDELGFDNAWLAESHFYPRFSIAASPLMLAAAAAQRTKRIRLGVAVNLLPLHNPIRIAEDVTTLDILSDGRAEFGVGRGAVPVHFEGFNIPAAESRERFIESLAFITRAWSSDEFSFEGKYYRATDLRLEPKPLQKPHPPVRIASNSDDTFDLVGGLGYSIFVSPVVISRPRLLENIVRYRRTLAARGYPVGGDEVSLQVPFYVAKSVGEARTFTEASVMNYLDAIKEGLDPTAVEAAAVENPGRAETTRRLLGMTYQNWYNDVAIYGDPPRCTEGLLSLQQEFQPGELICWFNVGGLVPHSEVVTAMRLFAEKVMPHFR